MKASSNGRKGGAEGQRTMASVARRAAAAVPAGRSRSCRVPARLTASVHRRSRGAVGELPSRRAAAAGTAAATASDHSSQATATTARISRSGVGTSVSQWRNRSGRRSMAKCCSSHAAASIARRGLAATEACTSGCGGSIHSPSPTASSARSLRSRARASARAAKASRRDLAAGCGPKKHRVRPSSRVVPADRTSSR